MHSESGKSADKRRGRWLDGAEASEDDSASLATESSVPEDELEDLPVAASRGQVQGPVSQAQGARQRDRHMSVRQGSKLLRRQVAFGEGSAGAHLMREADFMSRHAHVEADRGPEQGGTKAGRRWCVATSGGSAPPRSLPTRAPLCPGRAFSHSSSPSPTLRWLC